MYKKESPSSANKQKLTEFFVLNCGKINDSLIKNLKQGSDVIVSAAIFVFDETTVKYRYHLLQIFRRNTSDIKELIKDQIMLLAKAQSPVAKNSICKDANINASYVR